MGIRSRRHVIVELIIKRVLIDGLLKWLRETRKPLANGVSRLDLEDETLKLFLDSS